MMMMMMMMNDDVEMTVKMSEKKEWCVEMRVTMMMNDDIKVKRVVGKFLENKIK